MDSSPSKTTLEEIDSKEGHLSAYFLEKGPVLLRDSNIRALTRLKLCTALPKSADNSFSDLELLRGADTENLSELDCSTNSLVDISSLGALNLKQLGTLHLCTKTFDSDNNELSSLEALVKADLSNLRNFNVCTMPYISRQQPTLELRTTGTHAIPFTGDAQPLYARESIQPRTDFKILRAFSKSTGRM